jgi:hypothetical protein
MDTSSPRSLGSGTFHGRWWVQRRRFVSLREGARDEMDTLAGSTLSPSELAGRASQRCNRVESNEDYDCLSVAAKLGNRIASIACGWGPTLCHQGCEAVAPWESVCCDCQGVRNNWPCSPMRVLLRKISR